VIKTHIKDKAGNVWRVEGDASSIWLACTHRENGDHPTLAGHGFAAVANYELHARWYQTVLDGTVYGENVTQTIGALVSKAMATAVADVHKVAAKRFRDWDKPIRVSVVIDGDNEQPHAICKWQGETWEASAYLDEEYGVMFDAGWSPESWGADIESRSHATGEMFPTPVETAMKEALDAHFERVTACEKAIADLPPAAAEVAKQQLPSWEGKPAGLVRLAKAAVAK
jgi:hypothetical protein